ncbi:MAG: Gfo/Idh/MocA family oxidoreductase [Planctomycetaceae bacterium]
MSQLSRRKFLSTAAALGAGVGLSMGTSPSFALANDEINVGFISCGGRAGEHMRVFRGMSGVNVGALCDPDEQRLDSAKRTFPNAKGFADLRDLLDDDTVDAVVVATSNHWHCLASIWAMQAGKHVYVEKPLSHNQWEGRQTVNAAARYKKICQIGTQQRSDPMQAEIKKFLHEKKELGDIVSARVNRYGVRPSIGKRNTPLPIPDGVNYDLWLGPAQDKPIFRDKLQYDWHWDWNTGSGEMGNWGVHVLDDLRNNVFQDSVSLPKRIFGGGGRIVYNDAGETPNVHFVYFDTGSIPVVIGLSNLPAGPGVKGSPKHPGPGSGYIAYCEGGRFEGQRGGGKAFDKNGKEIASFKGNSGNGLHQQNFIDAVRADDPSILAAPVSMGHDSTGWCNLANIAFRAGGAFDQKRADSFDDPQGIWGALLDEMQEHVGAYSMKLTNPQIRLSTAFDVDVEKEVFVGEHAEVANQFLSREYRAPYTVPEISAS